MERSAEEDGEPALSVAAVARRMGVAPATLRTWDRRYGIGPSGHTTGRHRRYGPQDIARLEWMQRALLRGATPAEAARYALSVTAARPGRAGPPAGQSVVAEGDFAPDPHRPAQSGGRGLRLPGACRQARGLGRAVLAMDSLGAQRLLADAIAATGVTRTWDEVVRPVMAAVVQRWENSGAGAEVAHLLRESVLATLLRATPLLATPRNPRPVLLACVPGESSSLPLYGLVAALARREVETRMLGAALPADALVAAVRRIAPAAVVLWAHLPRHADLTLLRRLPRTRQRARLFLGGPGWRAGADAARFALPDGLGASADEIERVVLGTDR